MLANFFMPNVVKLRQRQSEARTARRVRPPMYDGLLDDEDEEDDIIQLRRQRRKCFRSKQDISPMFARAYCLQPKLEVTTEHFMGILG